MVAGVGLLIYELDRAPALPGSAIAWLLAGGLAALACLLAAVKSPSRPADGTAWAIVASAILAWQCLLSSLGAAQPQRSAYQMLAPVRPLIHPETQLFSIGQYRETISPYLGRELTLVDFTGELAFGLSEEPAKVVTPSSFLERWSSATDAIAFLDPAALEVWRQRGLTGRVISQDQSTVAVSRL